MHKFSTHTGVAAPLMFSNVDTDQIIPAIYLKRITRSGFDDALFGSWRSNEPDFILNQDAYKDASILVAGPDFGTGSSREHAVWALQDYGFRAVLSSRFADIFRSNSGKRGLLTAVLEQADVEKIWDYLRQNVGAALTVDLERKVVLAGDESFTFEIDENVRYKLLHGLDDIGLTLEHLHEIDAFEKRRPAFKPTTLPVKTQGMEVAASV
ncbi:MAG: 3-isopropylmalate dehydratase small subunit [Candidatus Ancillula trichonymphae]|jgi:3-isopropylmalate/(R)-2-methylmalate dehydratase small subunit|nr:3-isopropylmalate dehydratase small subunit [Candidatus Ancillula trichonymphae]